MIEQIPQIVEIDCTTGESITRDMTSEEISNMEELRKASAERDLQEAVKKEEREAAIKSAKEKLASLGLNESEINAIVGYN
jgi:hypothetical protein